MRPVSRISVLVVVVRVVVCGDGEDLRGRPGPEPRVQQEDGYHKEKGYETAPEAVDDQGLLELFGCHGTVAEIQVHVFDPLAIEPISVFCGGCHRVQSLVGVPELLVNGEKRIKRGFY